ncbi:TPM domain-containing protein, partial [bacterium]|nr:TPM domain-containing protein [bacterium]
MKQLLVAIVGILTGVAFVAPASAFEVSARPQGFVNDYASVLTPETIASLESTLVVFTASTSNEISVVTVPDMGGDYIEHYAVTLAQKWGVGDKQKDNGIMLLLSKEEHAIRIEVGYGLEGAVPDSVANRIIQNDMVPYLKQGDYDTAVTNAVTSLIKATNGEYKNNVSVSMKDIESALPFIFVFGALALQWLGAILGRTKQWWLGGLLGAGLGVSISTFIGWWLIGGAFLTLGLTLFGLLFDYVVSSTAA